jgi:energy-coupling factor transporter ATP-binding protein EcfA2
MAPRCRDYLYSGNDGADIVIRTELYRKEIYESHWTDDMIAYMESCSQFYRRLPDFGGLFLHASAVVMDGRAYLFSGHSGAGKSTHTRLWQQVFGPDARVINDDKPVLRRQGGRWIAYGTPWCGKDGINLNESAPLAGICYLKKGQKNEIRTLNKREAMERILAQTIRKFPDAAHLDQLLGLLDQLLAEIPVYELENLPQPEAAHLSFETMRRGAQEAGL